MLLLKESEILLYIERGDSRVENIIDCNLHGPHLQIHFKISGFSLGNMVVYIVLPITWLY